MKKFIVLSFLIVTSIGVYGQRTVTTDGYVYGKYDYHCEDGVLFARNDDEDWDLSYVCETLVRYPQNKTANSYTIPDGTYVIVKGAFRDNKYLKTIRIPSSVKFIGDNAFDGCDQLTSIDIYQSTSSARAVEADDSPSEAKEVGRYNIQGVKVQKDENGQVQIILYSDGTSQKVINK